MDYRRTGDEGERMRGERRGEEGDWRSARADEAKSTGEEEKRMRGEATLKIQSGIELGCSSAICITKR